MNKNVRSKLNYLKKKQNVIQRGVIIKTKQEPEMLLKTQQNITLRQ